MRGDDVAAANSEKLLEISEILFTIDNDFHFIESSIRSWFFFEENGHGYPVSERTEQAVEMCGLLRAIQEQLAAELPAVKKFESLICSESREDWKKILQSILPELRGQMIRKLNGAFKKLEPLPSPMWADLLPSVFADQVLPLFRSKEYLSAVRRGCDVLRAVIRARTGLHDLDGADLVNQALGDRGLFHFDVWEGHSASNVQRGYTDMLRGAMTGIRNPHYHGTEELSEQEAARLLVLLGTLWQRADSIKKIASPSDG